MKTKNILTTGAIAALALPGAAFADQPADPGSQGKAKGKAKQEQKTSKAKKAKGVGFTVKGTELSGLTVTDGKLAGPFTLDPTSANRHARDFLGLTSQQVAGEDTATLGTAADAVTVRLNGLNAGEAILPTDSVKVIGKVTRVKKGDTTTTRTLDIRKVTITRGSGGDSTPTTTTAAKSQSKSTDKTAPGYVCRNEDRTKDGSEGKSDFAECVDKANDKQEQQGS